MVHEAPLERTEGGLAPTGDGWFTVSLREAAWIHNGQFGEACVLEGQRAEFPQIGYTVAVLRPGQPSGLYHREQDQEDFVVLRGECLVLIEGQERRLRAGDFVHCPAGTDHIFVGAGKGPCVIFMIGARAHPERIVYPCSAQARRHGAGVEAPTSRPSEAYAPFPEWRPARPEGLDDLLPG